MQADAILNYSSKKIDLAIKEATLIQGQKENKWL